MPFTVSHIAAVIPGYRWLSRAQVFSAAVIGSMVPDFGLLVPRALSPARWETHSRLALLTFCLPVGLVSYLLLQFLLRPVIVEVLPNRAYARLSHAPSSALLSRASSWGLVAGALLLGAMTHLLWDNFTHETAYSVRTFTVLGDEGPDFFGHPMRLYRWLQLMSSIVGLVIVIAALCLWLRHAPRPAQSPRRRLSARERLFWIALYLVPSLLLAWWVVRRDLEYSWVWVEWALAHGAAYWLRGMVGSLLLVSALLRLRLALI